MSKHLWTLEEFGFQPEKLNHYETIFSVGNGYLSTRATFEEGYPGALNATLVHGIFNHAPGRLVPDLVNAPDWLPLLITIDGTPFRLTNINKAILHPPGGAVLGYRRTLDMREAVLRREVLFRAESNAVVRLVFERFASLHDEHVLAQRLTLIGVDGAPDIEVTAFVDHRVNNDGVQHWANIEANHAGPLTTVSLTAPQSGYRMGVAMTFGGAPVESVVHDGIPALRAHFRLDKESQVSLEKTVALYTSRDTADPVGAAREKVVGAAATGFAALLDVHRTEWATCWETSDVQIEGDDAAQTAIRFTQYHILICAPRHDDDVSIGAKTLSGLGYKGHVFWDTELFILPPLVLTHPAIARNLLMYRYRRLSGARHKAHANGYEGAMFPWESTDTGEETTPQWSDPMPDGTRIRIWTGDTEQHISTDIAYAVIQYWRWTGDDDFMRQYGAEIVLDTAVFWGSRVEWKAEAGRYEISQQIGPDEYHENVDNSVFTNRMVVWHLEEALSLLEWLQSAHPAEAQRLIAALKLTDERLTRWRDIIGRMFIPFDEEKQIHVQFPGFFDLEYIPVPHYEPRTLSVQAIIGHKRSVQSQVLKQADVIMLMALIGDSLASREVFLNNWNTYYPRTDHGSSLSPSVHAWMAARLGLDDEALYLFDHAATIDLKDNKGNVRDGIHGAASGGLWQALVFGICGLQIGPDGTLRTDPHLPAHWRRVAFNMYYRGVKYHFQVAQEAR